MAAIYHPSPLLILRQVKMEFEKVPKEDFAIVDPPKPKPMAREGKLIIRPFRLHLASFNGKHNHTKVRVFIFLFNTQNTYLSALEISNESLVSYGYCRNRLRYWAKWGYLKRRLSLRLDLAR